MTDYMMGSDPGNTSNNLSTEKQIEQITKTVKRKPITLHS